MKNKTLSILILALAFFTLATMYFSYNLGKDAAKRDKRNAIEERAVINTK